MRGKPINLSASFVELAFGSDGAPPTELRIFTAGKNESMKGDFLFDDKAAKSVMASAAKRGVDFAFDYNHGSTSALGMLNPEMSGKAAGWCKLAVKDGELWATDVRWTEAAASAIGRKEWRYVSPTFQHDKDNRVTAMLAIALTNTPALHNLDPLVAASATEPQEDRPMEQLLVMLGLAATATEAQAIVALNALNAKITSLTAAKDAAEAKSVELATKVAEMTAAAEVAELNALIARGQAEHKIAPAMVDVLRPLGVKGLTAYLEKAPKLVGALPSTEPKTEPGTGVAGLSAVELANCKQLGVDPEKYAAHKAKLKPAAA